MAKSTLTTNQVLFDTIKELKKLSNKTGEAVWKAVAEKLSASASQRPQVNLTRIEKFVKEGETVIIPGKLLGDGIISKKVTVVCFNASESAAAKMKVVGGSIVYIKDYISKKPDNKIRIIG